MRQTASAIAQQNAVIHRVNGDVAVPAFRIAFQDLGVLPCPPFIFGYRHAQRYTAVAQMIRYTAVVIPDQQQITRRQALDRRR